MIRNDRPNYDDYRCVLCGRSIGQGVNLDAHHIIERRLWTAPNELGGYFIENGASLCDTGIGEPYSCHMKAGMTLWSPTEIREAAGIKKEILPEHLHRQK